MYLSSFWYYLSPQRPQGLHKGRGAQGGYLGFQSHTAQSWALTLTMTDLRFVSLPPAERCASVLVAVSLLSAPRIRLTLCTRRFYCCCYCCCFGTGVCFWVKQNFSKKCLLHHRRFTFHGSFPSTRSLKLQHGYSWYPFARHENTIDCQTTGRFNAVPVLQEAHEVKLVDR